MKLNPKQQQQQQQRKINKQTNAALNSNATDIESSMNLGQQIVMFLMLR